MIFGYIINYLNQIPWSMIFLITQYFGIRLYILNKKEECQAIYKRLNWSSHIENGKPSGYSIGYWYIMSIDITSSEYCDTYNVWIIATQGSYEALTKNDDNSSKVKSDTCLSLPIRNTQLSIIERIGSFSNIYYKKRELKLSLYPRVHQEPIIQLIIEEYNRRSNAVVLLHGKPGTGKSMIGLLLARELKGSYCNTFKPWQPGDTLSNLYVESNVSEENPLIIAMDEIDVALMNIHSGIPQHKNICINICDKTGWNQMLDEIQRGIYPFLILFLTTNKTPEFIRDLDPSYIRENRVNTVININ